jgi:hypothetical protein
MVRIRCFLVLHQQAVHVETAIAKMLVLLVDQVAVALVTMAAAAAQVVQALQGKVTTAAVPLQRLDKTKTQAAAAVVLVLLAVMAAAQRLVQAVTVQRRQ